MNCKVCESEDITQWVDAEDIIYKGFTISVDTEYSVCNNCGREFISKQQIQNNAARIRDAKGEWHVERYLKKEVVHE